MHLYCSAASPFARKVRVVAHERGLSDRIQETIVNPYEDPAELIALNPAGKLPTLVTDDRAALYDSPVICAYLDTHPDATGTPLVPRDGPARWHTLRGEALADAAMDLGLALTMEGRKPENERSPTLASRQRGQLVRVIAAIATEVEASKPAWTLAQIGYAVALDYLDLRHPDLAWRDGHAELAAWHGDCVTRPSMTTTAPH